jgi:hypothetical protein
MGVKFGGTHTLFFLPIFCGEIIWHLALFLKDNEMGIFILDFDPFSSVYF